MSPEGKILWRWTPPAELQADLRQDCAEEYAIEQCETAIGGVVLWAKCRGEWSCNPWNVRHVIAALLRRLPTS